MNQLLRRLDHDHHDPVVPALYNIGNATIIIGIILSMLTLVASFIAFLVLCVNMLMGQALITLVLAIPAAFLEFLPFYINATIVFGFANNIDNNYKTAKYTRMLAEGKSSGKENSPTHTKKSSNQKPTTVPILNHETYTNTDSQPQNVQKSTHKWRCPACDEIISSEPCFNCGFPAKKEVPVSVSKNTDGSFLCPVCKAMQKSDSSVCLNCGQKFINNQDAPYWCAKCGAPGPFEKNCPVCGSTMRKINNK